MVVENTASQHMAQWDARPSGNTCRYIMGEPGTGWNSETVIWAEFHPIGESTSVFSEGVLIIEDEMSAEVETAVVASLCQFLARRRGIKGQLKRPGIFKRLSRH